MKKIDNRLLAINIVGGVVMVTAAVTWVKGVFSRPYVEVCQSRYNRTLAMRLDKGGRAMEPAEVQAATNGLDRGILENLHVATLKGGPAPYALTVNVANQSAPEVVRKEEAVADGTIFPWLPGALKQGVSSACVTYHVKLSDDFDFQAGVMLPGIYALRDGGAYTDETRVDTNILISADGTPRLRLYAKGSGGVADAAYGLYERHFPLGRWVKVEQEVVLNTPGKADGVVRLWFDDKIELEVKDADLRDTAEVSFAGVSSTITRGRKRNLATPDPKPATIQVTPFEVRIN